MDAVPEHHPDPSLLQVFLVSWRENYPNPSRTLHGRQRQVGLSQLDVAGAAGLSIGLVGKIERRVRNLPVRRIDDFADAYCMDGPRRDHLWRLITGEYSKAGPAAPDPEAVRAWNVYLHSQPHITVALDPSWRVREGNAAWRALFDGADQSIPDNFLEWLLWSAHARTVCADWQDGWIAPLLQELRIELQHQSTPELQRICARVRADQHLSALWQSMPTGRSVRHNDGQLRLLRRAGQLEQVRLLVSTPAHNPLFRVLQLMPADLALPIPAAPRTRRDWDRRLATDSRGTSAAA